LPQPTDDQILLWQDVLEEIAAGKKQKLSCPVCREGELNIEERGSRMRISCPRCREFVETTLGY